NIAQTGEPVRMEYHHKASDRWYSMYGFRVSSNGNRQVAVLSTDITEQKRRKQRKDFLEELANAMRAATDTIDTERIACGMLANELGVGSVFYAAINEAENKVTITNESRGDTRSLSGTHKLSEYSWAIPLCRQERPLIVDDLHHNKRIPLEYRPAMEALGLVSFAAVPIVRNGVLIGAVAASERTSHQWGEHEMLLIKVTAEHICDETERSKAQKQAAKELEDSKKLQEISTHLIDTNDVGSLYDALLVSALDI